MPEYGTQYDTKLLSYCYLAGYCYDGRRILGVAGGFRLHGRRSQFAQFQGKEKTYRLIADS